MAVTLLNAASVYAEKAPAFWVDIAAACLARRRRDLEAVWIGRVEPGYAALAREAEAASGGRIRFPGPADNTDVLAAFAAPGAVLLIASDIEVFPLSIMEAAQAGAPIVCRRFPGWDEVLGGDYPLAFSTVDEAVARVEQVVADLPAARGGPRALFEARFRKDEAWYEGAAAIWARAARR